MPWNVRFGYIEPDAVPSPMLVDGGFEENETATDAFSGRSRERLGGSCVLSGPRPPGGGGTEGRRGVVECLAKNSSEVAPVLASSRSALLSLLGGGSTTCVSL